MAVGKVKFFNSDKGYGFISAEDGSGDSFVHISAVEQSGLSSLSPDERVSYDLERDKKGKFSAVNLKRV